jgi:MtN3 and saliva related transmembrane protein
MHSDQPIQLILSPKDRAALVPRFGDEAGCAAGTAAAHHPLKLRPHRAATGAHDMAATWINLVGVAAAACSMASFIPQIAKIVRERDASAVSLRMYLVTVTGFVFWIAYGLLIGSWPVAASNMVNLMLSATILALKWRLDGAESS